MPDRAASIEQVQTVLGAAPPRLAALAAGLTPAQLRASPKHDEWSANDVLAHLRACSDVWGGCIVTIINEEEPTLRAVNPRTWIDKTDYRELEFEPSLHAFARQRRHLLAILRQLPASGWSRSATVTGAGRPLQRTVLFYAEWLARHERTHIRQVERIVTTLRSNPRLIMRTEPKRQQHGDR
jgi:DinB family protein